MVLPANAPLAGKLRNMADVLEQQAANEFRILAYRRAAESIAKLSIPVGDIVSEKGLKGLVALPAIGKRIGAALVEMVTTGRWTQWDRVQGALEPEKLFRTIAMIGPELAKRIHDDLHIDTLEALETAAHDGRLEQVVGIGPRRATAIRAALKERLSRRRVRASLVTTIPPIDFVFDVDREYRHAAKAGTLPMISPKRYNSKGEAWLPILHTKRGDWEFTALFSNSRKANELQKTHDWVILYAHQGDGSELQCTLVTETKGTLAGRRVIRGHETESARHYFDLE